MVACVTVACVAGVQRGGRGEVECEREARSLGARRERAPNDRASRSHSTSPLPPLCTPATQASVTVENFKPIILDTKSGRGCQREAVAYKVKIIVISQAKFGDHIPLPETVDISQGAITGV